MTEILTGRRVFVDVRLSRRKSVTAVIRPVSGLATLRFSDLFAPGKVLPGRFVIAEQARWGGSIVVQGFSVSVCSGVPGRKGSGFISRQASVPARKYGERKCPDSPVGMWR
jgi:hypothetical protein